MCSSDLEAVVIVLLVGRRVIPWVLHYVAHTGSRELFRLAVLAIALGVSARSVQRALEQLSSRGKVQSVGNGRACRWMTPPVPGFPTTLLLPGPAPGG